MESLLEVIGLTTLIPTTRGVVRAVDGVDLTIAAGEAVALVGESGCGKSMTALSIVRLLRSPARIDAGRILFEGIDLAGAPESQLRAIRGARIGMVFQDPMTFLNPLRTVGSQVAEAVRVHQGASRRAAFDEAARLFDRVRLPQPQRSLGLYPHQLSGGMRQRVMIAMAVSCKPALLIADEPTTALDVTIQAQIMQLLADLRREMGGAMLLITHDLGLVAEYSDRVNVMYAGEIVESAPTADLFASPRHPYTRGLLAATLGIHKTTREFRAIEGQPPDLAAPPSGCRFHPRCASAIGGCALPARRFHAFDAGYHRCDVAGI